MASNATKKDSRVRVAVIGAGNMGKNHLRNYKEMPEADLVGIADINPATKKLADEQGIKYFSDYREMLDKLKPEAVSIVVPTPFHAEVATAALERGSHCLVEKPIASTVAEADALISLAKKRGLVFTVGHIERYNPVVRQLKKLVDEKKIGEITSIVSKRVGGFPSVEPKTDVIIDLAVHDIDIISYLLGEQPHTVHSHGSRTHHTQKVDSAEILMKYSKASGFVQANWLTPVKIRTIALTGSLGYLEANYINQELHWYRHNMEKLGDFTKFVQKLGAPVKEILQVSFQEPLAVELRTFLQHVRGDKSDKLVEPTDAREALRLALESIRPYETA